MILLEQGYTAPEFQKTAFIKQLKILSARLLGQLLFVLSAALLAKRQPFAAGLTGIRRGAAEALERDSIDKKAGDR